jgi:hypothetical protein
MELFAPRWRIIAPHKIRKTVLPAMVPGKRVTLTLRRFPEKRT